MQPGNMGIPCSPNIDSETERMVFRETKVIRNSFIHEGERAGRSSVPSVRRNYIESGLQLCFEQRRSYIHRMTQIFRRRHLYLRHSNINAQACGLLSSGFQELFRGAEASSPFRSPRIALHGDVFTADFSMSKCTLSHLWVICR